MARKICKEEQAGNQWVQYGSPYGYSGCDKEVETLLMVLKCLDLSVSDAIEAVVSRVGPPGARGIISNWKKLKHFGCSAPPATVIEQVFEESNFRCEECRTQLRLSLDHKDCNAANHARENLALKCMPCNQGFTHKKTKLTLAAIQLFNELGEFPDEATILEAAGIDKVDSYRFYLMSFLRSRLEASNRVKRMPRLVAELRRLVKSGKPDCSMRDVDIVLEIVMEAEKVAGKGIVARTFIPGGSLLEHAERLANVAMGTGAVLMPLSTSEH